MYSLKRRGGTKGTGARCSAQRGEQLEKNLFLTSWVIGCGEGEKKRKEREGTRPSLRCFGSRHSRKGFMLSGLDVVMIHQRNRDSMQIAHLMILTLDVY